MRFDPLPRNLVLAKPVGQESYNAEVLTDLESAGHLIGTRKRDGHKLLAEVCESKRIRLYRSGMDQVDGRLDYLRQEIASLGLPPGTVLVGELVVERGAGHAEDLGAVTTILGGALPTAKQALAQGLLPTFVVFNALAGPKLAARPYGETLPWLHRLLDGGAYVVAVEEVLGGFASMQEASRDGDWEGLVLYDSAYRLTWRLGSTEPRPKGCYKLKPVNEDDFIVFARHRRFNADGTLKDVLLLQWDPERRKLMECTRLGSFNAGTRALLAADGWDLKVMQARYVRRYPKSGKLREPAFMRLRDDKNPDACIAPRSWPEAEYIK